ncbi:MAG: BadF/BadG/BcrA/BcrD ATPase family protein [Pseudomonadota bacterium]
MTDLPDTPVLAIDGGGTRCRFALADGADCRIIEGGSANASTDFDNAVRCLREGIQTLADRAGVGLDRLYQLPAFVGLAGLTGEVLSAQMAAALPLQNARYADDRLAALRGALGRRDGLLAHCGTGSFFAAQFAGRQRLAGGWGSVLGDEASAQWIGRKALNTLLQQVDGFIEATPLTNDLLTQFHDSAAVVEFSRRASPAAFGALAPQVSAYAERGDLAAIKIMQSGADHIASDLRRLGWQPGLTVCLTGGIGPQYASYLPDDMAPDLIEPLGQPLDGAIALAQEKETTDGNC